jgi:SAM-dependent methyltransferase
LRKENQKFAESIPDGSMVLDAGAGSQPYKSLLQHTQYEAADFEKVDKPYAKSTYVCDLKDIPVEDKRYDYILFNQVMEHLPEPKAVLRELYRVLKPEGKLIYTGPFFYEEHEIPFDFYRYTQFSLKRMFKEAGFRIERLDWVEGYFGTLGYQLNRMARYLPVKPASISPGLLGFLLCPLMILLKFISALLSILFHRLETIKKYTKEGYPKNYIAILEKPSEQLKSAIG